MPDVLRGFDEDHLFTQVHGEISNPLEAPRDEQQVDEGRGSLLALLDQRGQRLGEAFVKPVQFMVAGLQFQG